MSSSEYSGEQSDSGSSQEIYVDQRETFNRKWGYIPPLDKEIVRIIEAVAEDPACAESLVGIGPENEEYLDGLQNRNVLLVPSRDLDPYEEKIRSMSVDGYLQESEMEKAFHEKLWIDDRVKCIFDASSALHHRTLIMNLIPRHLFIYSPDEDAEEQTFDFSVEKPWNCRPMPSRLFWNRDEDRIPAVKYLTQPKLNLAVCFTREAVIPDSLWGAFTEPMKDLVYFGSNSESVSRVFHFLVVEYKNPEFGVIGLQLLHQCLNSASQALHNMYVFFRDAGPEHERVFFDQVRFFSIVATYSEITVRIHRATRIRDGESVWRLIMPDRPDYRLEFEFRDIARMFEPSREKVLEVVRRIFKYAHDDLAEAINAAAKTLVKKVKEDFGQYQARRNGDFYTYGQP